MRLPHFQQKATNAFQLFPDVRTVLDIGSHNSKAIQVKPGGDVAHFEMNDRCSAGTKRFLKSMARIMNAAHVIDDPDGEKHG